LRYDAASLQMRLPREHSVAVAMTGPTAAEGAPESAGPPGPWHLDLRIGEVDLDSLGHVNHAAYVRMLETARMAFYRAVGLQLEGDVPPRLGTVVVNLNVDFRAECVAGDRLRVSTRGLRRGRRSFTLAQHMARDDGTPVVDAAVTSVVMDLDRRVVVALPSQLAAMLPAPEAG
jgi:acyl-CoA thioester hydrolase/thioesterase-3